MAITSELIGKLGGGGGEATPVEAVASGDRHSEEILHTVEIPEGETWLIALHGDLNSSSVGSPSAQLVIGSTLLPSRTPNGTVSLVHVGTGTTHVKLRRNNNIYSDSFTGYVVAGKM